MDVLRPSPEACNLTAVLQAAWEPQPRRPWHAFSLSSSRCKLLGQTSCAKDFTRCKPPPMSPSSRSLPAHAADYSKPLQVKMSETPRYSADLLSWVGPPRPQTAHPVPAALPSAKLTCLAGRYGAGLQRGVYWGSSLLVRHRGGALVGRGSLGCMPSLYDVCLCHGEAPGCAGFPHACSSPSLVSQHAKR